MKTLRQEIIDLLGDTEMSARDISRAMRIKEKEVYDHIGHIQRSLAAQKKKLHIRPSRCRKCGYVFTDRTRFTRPGRCPRCRGTYLQEPAFRIR